jgi:hypothetical protein
VADAALTPAALTFRPKEGIAFTGVVATFRDGNTNPDLADYSATIVWGDGTTSAGTSAANGTGGFKVTGTHTYAEEGSYAATVTIHDAGGSMAVVHSTAAVADAPLHASGKPINEVLNQTFTERVASFSDGNASPDIADFSATIDWGDGSTTAGTVAANGSGGFDVSGMHTYTATGSFAMIVTIHDVGGSTAVAHSTANVAGGAPAIPWYPHGPGGTGGAGSDKLTRDDNLLIGSTASSDAALAALMTEWTSPAAYADRTDGLPRGGGLTGSTDFDDGVEDTLTGGFGLDGFWQLAGDKITDLDNRGPETVN